MGPSYFYIFEYLSKHLLFKIILFIWTFAFFYHLFNGVRFLYWTYGFGMDLRTVYFSGYIVLFLTILSTFFVWLI